MNKFIKYLEGGDLRSIADVDKLIPLIESQRDFDCLFQYLFVEDRLVVMRAVDAIEKISLKKSKYLTKYKKDIIDLMGIADNKELKWHLALMVSRINFSIEELKVVWSRLRCWATDKKESKIVRVNSIQALFDFSEKNRDFKKDFDLIIRDIRTENIRSVDARLRRLGV
ncbi:MAG: hypothetical protein CR982_08580 [Candidatus Cloacimonadota bacterium]|nr:MAG: hypothetical protein CR982_08580 [Candidatus Cloacimonadota bacterium]PIE78688.1 MAG: hypothetical protein CSA15_06505 [Candidatus Delongbacteria bacterium]